MLDISVGPYTGYYVYVEADSRNRAMELATQLMKDWGEDTVFIDETKEIVMQKDAVVDYRIYDG